MQAAYILLLALFLSMLLIAPLKRIAGSLQLTDAPGDRKVHTRPIPRTGGVAIAFGALIPVWVFVPLDREVSGFLAAASAIFVSGLLDDRFNLDYRLKLLGQVLASLVAVVGGGISVQELPLFTASGLPEAAAIPLTVFLLVGITNAVNLSDGLDGLAGGISLLALGCLATLAHQGGDHAAFSICVAMMGATFGFLRYNSNPAQIFMGDSGSQFLGFGTGLLAIMVTQGPDSAYGVLVPILVLAVPILDTLTVIVRRIVSGRSPFSADQLHIHHELLRAGLNQTQAVTLVYLTQLLAVALAYAMRYSADAAVLGIYLVFCALVLLGLRRLSERPAHADGPAHPRPHLKHSKALAAVEAYSRRALKSAPRALIALVPLVLIAGATLAEHVSLDIAVMAVGLMVLGVLTEIRKSSAAAAVERLMLYATSVMVVSLASPHAAEALGPQLLAAVFAALAILTAIWIRTTRASFRTNSLDLLILTIAITLPLLSEALAQSIGLLVLQAVILFYAIEVLLLQDSRRWSPLKIAALIALAILALKST